MKFNMILFVLCLCINMILGSIADDSPYWKDPVQFCGPRLSAELAIICKGIYNEVRSIQQMNKLKRAVVDDCCLQTCKRRFLKTHYCGPEPELYVSSAQKLREMKYVNYTYYYSDLLWIAIQFPQTDE